MLRIIFSIITLIFVSGCTFSGMKQFSEGLQFSPSESKVTLYSIEPNVSNSSSQARIHGYPILGSLRLDHIEAEKLIGILEDGVWRWRWENSILRSEVACFNPRHIVQIENEKDKFDYVICFECEGIEVYKNGVQYSYAGVSASQNKFDEALVGRGVPLATY